MTTSERRHQQLLRCAPRLRTKHAEAAASFYCDKLGFTKDWEHRFGPGFPLYLQLSRDGLLLHFSEHEGDGPFEIRIYFYVRDVLELHREMTLRGAPATEVVRQSWGMDEFLVTDPDGNHIWFGSPPKASKD